MSQDEGTLLDLAAAATRILSFVAGLTKEDFLEDPKTQSAVLHQLLVLGEATKRLSVEFRTEHSEIPLPRTAYLMPWSASGWTGWKKKLKRVLVTDNKLTAQVQSY